jgi:CoA-transferase family III
MGPLEGVKVIDMTTVLMGPYATQMLGDYGADVIKVESLDGDVTRLIGPTRHPGMGPVFLNTNRSKRSIALDLKKPAGRDVVLRLIASADVLVYNVRPQAMARLQLGYDVVSRVNPRLIYAGVFGFGQDGPYAAKPAYDDLIQGATALPALMAQTGDGVPRYVPNALVDRIVGLTAVGRDLREPCASGPYRTRPAGGYSDVRDHGGFCDGRSHGRPDLRATAGQGRLCAASVARPQALQNLRRLHLGDRLQRQAVGKILRGDRPGRSTLRSEVRNLRRPC